MSPDFDPLFVDKLDDLFVWRRDVRHFKTTPLADGVLDEVLDRACLSPSVGNSQPWRFVKVDEGGRRAAVVANFEMCNHQALNDYQGEQARLYASLKLAGLKNAPVHLAVFTDTSTAQGSGLGRKTMPEMLHYSSVCMIMGLWLLARARGVGVGWVSIVDPEEIANALEVPDTWELDAYLCIGYADEQDITPELERLGWQSRSQCGRQVLQR